MYSIIIYLNDDMMSSKVLVCGNSELKCRARRRELLEMSEQLMDAIRLLSQRFLGTIYPPFSQL